MIASVTAVKDVKPSRQLAVPTGNPQTWDDTISEKKPIRFFKLQLSPHIIKFKIQTVSNHGEQRRRIDPQHRPHQHPHHPRTYRCESIYGCYPCNRRPLRDFQEAPHNSKHVSCVCFCSKRWGKRSLDDGLRWTTHGRGLGSLSGSRLHVPMVREADFRGFL